MPTKNSPRFKNEQLLVFIWGVIGLGVLLISPFLPWLDLPPLFGIPIWRFFYGKILVIGSLIAFAAVLPSFVQPTWMRPLFVSAQTWGSIATILVWPVFFCSVGVYLLAISLAESFLENVLSRLVLPEPGLGLYLATAGSLVAVLAFGFLGYRLSNSVSDVIWQASLQVIVVLLVLLFLFIYRLVLGQNPLAEQPADQVGPVLREAEIIIREKPELPPTDDEVPTEKWVEKLAAIGEDRDKARKQILSRGEAALDAVLQGMKNADPAIRQACVELAPKIAGARIPEVKEQLKHLTRDDDAAVRVEAINTLSGIADPATEFLEELVEAVLDRDPHVRDVAVRLVGGLRQLEEKDVERLKTIVAKTGDARRANVLGVIASMPIDANVVRAVFIPCLSDKDPQVVAIALAVVEKKQLVSDPVVVKSLIRMTLATTNELQTTAWNLLKSINKFSVDQRNLLQDGLFAKNPQIRLWFLEQLGKMENDALPSASAIARLLQDEDRSVKLTAVKILTQFGNAAADFRADFLLLTSSEDAETRRVAIESLAKLPRDPRSDSILFEKLDDPDEGVRQAAQTAITNLQPPIGRGDQLLLRSALKSPNAATRRFAAKFYSQLGADVRESRFDLIAAAGDPDYPTRAFVMHALGEMKEDAKDAEPAIVKTFQEVIDAKEVKEGAATLLREAGMTLQKIGGVWKEAIPILMSGLKHENLDIRRAAAVALGHAGRDAAAAAKPISKMLTIDEAVDDAKQALLQIRGEETAEALCDILDSSAEALLKIRALETLGELGKDARTNRVRRSVRLIAEKNAGTTLGNVAHEIYQKISQ